MKTLLNKNFLLVLLFTSLFVGYVSAQSIFDIEFPIAELGNCASKKECKIYCDQEENFSACRAFASKHGLRDDSGGNDKFDAITEDGGPGNCAAGSANPVESCRRYCDNTSNMRQCVSYARAHNLMAGEELEEAEKVLAALDKGGKLPTGCTDRVTCEQICENPTNISVARECFAFAEAAGFLPPGVNREQAEKVFKAIEEGRAPFRSPKDFEQCDNPPNDEILEKCISFAVENGFISGEEAEMVKKTGGKGPGGCRGREQCESYCQTHEEECFAFAEQYDLMSPEEKGRVQEGINKFKEGINNAPPEVRACLESTIGAEVLAKILAGEKPPTRELGEKMRTCFESAFGREGEHRGGGEFGGQFPPEIKACLEGKIGAEGVKRLIESGPSPETESVMRGCFEANRGQFGPPGMEFKPQEGNYPDQREMQEKIFREQFEGQQQHYEGQFQQFPPGMSEEEMRRMMEKRAQQMQIEQSQQYFNQYNQYGAPGMMPPEGERPPEGTQYYPTGNYPTGSYPPPEGSYPPPPSNSTYQNSSGSYPPPEGYMPPPEGTTYTAPESYTPPPPPEEMPTSFLPTIKAENLLANVIYLIYSLFQR